MESRSGSERIWGGDKTRGSLADRPDTTCQIELYRPDPARPYDEELTAHDVTTPEDEFVVSHGIDFAIRKRLNEQKAINVAVHATQLVLSGSILQRVVTWYHSKKRVYETLTSHDMNLYYAMT